MVSKTINFWRFFECLVFCENYSITLIYNFFAPAPKIKSYTSSRYITFEKLYINFKKLYIKLAPQAKIWWKLSAAGEILKKIRVIYQFLKVIYQICSGIWGFLKSYTSTRYITFKSYTSNLIYNSELYINGFWKK